MFVYI